MGGSYHTWSSTFPDSRGLLINTCDLKLDKQNTTDGHSRIDLNGNYYLCLIIMHTHLRPFSTFCIRTMGNALCGSVVAIATYMYIILYS